jgi:hypothetical protein
VELAIKQDSFEIVTGQENLLITLGDSWTWGDSLGQIGGDILDDIEARKAQVYGRHLADALGADWINDGRCGGTNQVVVDKLEHYINTVDFDQYQQVYIVITLTETGREFGFVDYEIDFAKINDTIRQLEQDTLDRIHTLTKDSSVNLLVGRNFTDYYTTTEKYPWCVDKTWVQVLLEQLYQDNPKWQGLSYDSVRVTGIASGVGLVPMSKKYSNNPGFKLFTVETVDHAKKLWTFLELSPYNGKVATKHPTKEAHGLWAKYLLEKLATRG